MSVGSIGGQGYPDDQRVENWDGPPLLDTSGIAYNGANLFPGVDTARYAGIRLYASVITNPCNVVFTWFLDQALTMKSGVRVVGISPLINDSLQAFLPSMGPVLQVSTTVGSGPTPYTPNLLVFPTNRMVESPLLGASMDLLVLNNAVVNAGTSRTSLPSHYFAGPARLFVSSTQPSCTWQLQQFNANGGLDVIDSGTIPNTVVSSTAIVIPARAYQLTVTNNSAAAATIYAYITGSLTGGL